MTPQDFGFTSVGTPMPSPFISHLTGIRRSKDIHPRYWQMPCHDTQHLKRCETPPAPVFLVVDTPAVKYRNRHCKATRRSWKTPAPSRTECACANGSRTSINAADDSRLRSMGL
ncbi:hypothetical protein [Verminephrobacter eiseniae]|uniref:hypothetical protein n=1 Tax=Verminephrobacter eiseniae TaxID=364317 RepID=UPI002237127B|nr:hypothetical protein [Verminephrobacter eiseniae]